jgi:hypothetical protein
MWSDVLDGQSAITASLLKPVLQLFCNCSCNILLCNQIAAFAIYMYTTSQRHESNITHNSPHTCTCMLSSGILSSQYLHSVNLCVHSVVMWCSSSSSLYWPPQPWLQSTSLLGHFVSMCSSIAVSFPLHGHGSGSVGQSISRPSISLWHPRSLRIFRYNTDYRVVYHSDYIIQSSSSNRTMKRSCKVLAQPPGSLHMCNSCEWWPLNPRKIRAKVNESMYACKGDKASKAYDCWSTYLQCIHNMLILVTWLHWFSMCIWPCTHKCSENISGRD